jgi:U3 small nucleolar RNA-associated protein 7
MAAHERETKSLSYDNDEDSNHVSSKHHTTTTRQIPQKATSASDSKAVKKHEQQAVSQYGRGSKILTKSIKDKKLRHGMRTLERKYKEAAVRLKDAEILLDNDAGLLQPEEELERTYKVRQDEIRRDVGVEVAKQGFELKLEEMGPYSCEYSRNGKQMVLFGRKGHVSSMNWRNGKLGFEMQLGETVRDVKFLHNENLVAVAQKRNVYIYDQAGVEIHKLDKEIEVSHMEFLPYHFLLATVGNAGKLKYRDTSTGQIISEHTTHLGPTTSLAQNPHNAILHMGHQNGTVTLWSPNSSEPLVKLLPHHGVVRDIAIDRSGYYMTSVGQDSKLAVWDIRKFKEVHRYYTHQPATTLAISDRNLTAVGWGSATTIWADLFKKSTADAGKEQIKVQSPYMSWRGDRGEGAISRVRWCPFEDVLGVGHNAGFTSLIVPGAGEPNFDALETNPFETKKQRQEAEVKSLLDKLQPEMISLDPNFIGTLDTVKHEQRMKERELADNNGPSVDDYVEKLRKKARGKNTALKRYLRKKQRNVITHEKVRVQEAIQMGKERAQQRKAIEKEKYGPALARFATGYR